MRDDVNDAACLAVETATGLASVALSWRGHVWYREADGLRAPSRAVYAWIDGLLADAAIDIDQIGAVAYGAGPGSFTGVRVAATVAQAIGFARHLPVYRVSTLAALALRAARLEPAGEVVAACLDARMDQVYLGVYRRQDEGIGAAQLADRLLSPDAVSADVGLPWLAVGPGWAAYPQLATRAGVLAPPALASLLPTAREVLALALVEREAGRRLRAEEALPNYLRNEVANPGGARGRP